MINIFNNQTNNNFEMLQDARKDLCGEIHAIIQYDEHIKNATDQIARQTWINIKNEELTHIGELLGLLNYLEPQQQQFVKAGLTDFESQLNK